MNRLEEAGERGAAFTRYFFLGGGFGVGVFVRYWGVHFFSIEERIATGSAPDLCIIIASRATSIQTCHP
ncbi:MAG: hypothetical protein ACRD1H_19995 [Vicinamibacterales bacterium]